MLNFIKAKGHWMKSFVEENERVTCTTSMSHTRLTLYHILWYIIMIWRLNYSITIIV
jgi:hypothetical protein